MRINKEEARLLARYIDSTLSEYVYSVYDNERAHKGEDKAAAVSRPIHKALAAISEAFSEYGEDRRGNGRWNPNTDDMDFTELCERVYKRRAESLQGREQANGIYFDTETNGNL